MAYNPFNIFRRNQKALFAVLTVFVMIVFTLSSGIAGGDFFDTMSRWLGASKGSKEPVCKIDGHAVTVGELDQAPRGVQYNRVMANRFMYYAARQTVGNLMDYTNQQRDRLSEQGKQMANAANSAVNMMAMAAQLGGRQNPEIARFLDSQTITAERLIDMTLSSPAAKAEDKDVARAFQTVLALTRYLNEGQGEHYFVNAPNRSRRDLVEFLLWRKKADQLGIRFSRDDVKKLIQAEFYNAFKSDVEVRKILSQSQGFTIDRCMDALAAEFEVRAAQSAVLGHGARYGYAPSLGTPYEMFEFYNDKTAPATYDVLAVPAVAFLNQVHGEPSETEIDALYKKYADAEPNPRSETPGFKEPRKISVGWLAIKGDEPYYKKLAEEQVKVGEVMAKASGALTVPLPGAIGTWAAATVAPLSLKEPAVDAAYAFRVDRFRSEMSAKYSGSNITTRDLFQASEARPGVLASTLGGFVGQTAGFGNPAAAASVSMTTAIAYEIRDRVKVGLPLVMGWMTGPGLMPGLVGAAATSNANEPKPPSIESLRPELIKTAIDSRAKTLAFGDPMARFGMADKSSEKGDVARFIEELGKLAPGGKPKDRAAVEKYIKDFVTARGLTMGVSAAPHDEWTLEDDPGLKPLVDAHKSSLDDPMVRMAHGGVEQYSPFGRAFFWTADKETRRTVPATGLFVAERYPSEDRQMAIAEGRPHYVVWHTEEVQAKRTDRQQARPQVIAAWKLMKARELAQARANAIAEKIRNSPNSDPVLLESELRQGSHEITSGILDPKILAQVRQFVIPNVAPLVAPERPNPFAPQAPTRPHPFGLTESKNIPYPTPEMVSALIDNRDKGPKTVLVLPDAPKDTFYVALLRDRRTKNATEFTSDVYSPMGKYAELGGDFRAEQMRKSRASAVELLKKEFKYEETEDQKKSLDEKAGRSSD